MKTNVDLNKRVFLPVVHVRLTRVKRINRRNLNHRFLALVETERMKASNSILIRG